MFKRNQIVPALMVFLLSSTVAAGSQQILTAAQVKGKKILFVAGEPEKGETNDDPAIKKYLDGEGYLVSMANDQDLAAEAPWQYLILISSTAHPREGRC